MGTAIERRTGGTTGWRLRWRGRPAPPLILAVALGLALPAAAPAATTAKISPAFTAGRSLHFGYRLSEPAGGVPSPPTQLIVRLPKGTGINLGAVPKSQLCNFDILNTLHNGPKACPKGSHAGPTGSIEFEATIGGKPTIGRGTVKPFLVALADGSRAVTLYVEVSPPFSDGPMVTVLPYRGSELIGDVEVPGLTPGINAGVVGLSATIGQNAKITPPKTCPKRGYAWSVGFSYLESPDTTARATSPCLTKATRASIHRTSPAALTSAKPTTQFQCERAFKSTQGRAKCFSQLPGASCAHPLEVQKTSPNYRGDTRSFNVTLKDEPDGANALLTYEWEPKKNVAICPYPTGAVFRVSLLSQREHCQRIHGQEVCSGEYDTTTIPERTSRSGGRFMYEMPGNPVRSWYLVVRGYFIHPRWERQGESVSSPPLKGLDGT